MNGLQDGLGGLEQSAACITVTRLVTEYHLAGSEDISVLSCLAASRLYMILAPDINNMTYTVVTCEVKLFQPSSTSG